MFCPIGYTTVAELWERFHEKRIVSLYQSTTKNYHSNEFKASFVRGSPLDVCEHVFLKSLSIVGVCVASVDGRIFKLHAPLNDGENGLFSVLTPSSSANNAAASIVHNDNDDEVRSIAGYRFRAWDDEEIRNDWWKETYPLLSAEDLTYPLEVPGGLWYHTLPTCFERGSFKVVQKLPFWGGFFGIKGDTKAIVDSFAGWSLCLADEVLLTWEPYLDGKEVYPSPTSESTFTPQGGRPSKLEDALADFDMVFPHGKTQSIKKTLNRIEQHTGNRYSESTLSRAFKTREE